MNKVAFLGAVTALSAIWQVSPLGAQNAQQPPPRPTEPPANDRVGVSIDRFIGDANRAPSRVSHDVMFTRSIIRAGDPLQQVADLDLPRIGGIERRQTIRLERREQSQTRGCPEHPPHRRGPCLFHSTQTIG